MSLNELGVIPESDTKVVIIASTSEIKISATKLAFPGKKVISAKPNSSSAEQPIGFSELLHGSSNRVQSIEGFSSQGILLAIENGIVKGSELLRRNILVDALGLQIDLNGWYDLACVIIRENCLQVIEFSEAVSVPSNMMEEVFQYPDRSVTLGKVISSYFPDIPHQDPHGFLTNGFTNRQQLLQRAIEKAYIKLCKLKSDDADQVSTSTVITRQ